MGNRIITISREFGSGGRLVGKRLAAELGIPFYDKEIITLTARKSGLSEEYITKAEQKKTQSLLYGLYTSSQELPISDQVFISQSHVIQDIAARESAVVVGRCGDYALREESGCMRVFIHAPFEDRLRRVRDEYRIAEKNLEAYIRREDKNRAAYYNYFTNNKWGDAHNYHLSLDSSIGIGQVVRLVKDLYESFPPSAEE